MLRTNPQDTVPDALAAGHCLAAAQKLLRELPPPA
jgi:hypothetical protein